MGPAPAPQSCPGGGELRPRHRAQLALAGSASPRSSPALPARAAASGAPASRARTPALAPAAPSAPVRKRPRTVRRGSLPWNQRKGWRRVACAVPAVPARRGFLPGVLCAEQHALVPNRERRWAMAAPASPLMGRPAQALLAVPGAWGALPHLLRPSALGEAAPRAAPAGSRAEGSPAARGKHSLGTVPSPVLPGVLGGKGCSARGGGVGAAGSRACRAGCVACGDACLGSQSIFQTL